MAGKLDAFLLGLLIGLILILLIIPLHTYVYNTQVPSHPNSFQYKFKASAVPNNTAVVGNYIYKFTTYNTTDIRNHSLWYWHFVFLVGVDKYNESWLSASAIGNNSTSTSIDETYHPIPAPLNDSYFEGDWMYLSSWYLLWNGSYIYVQEPWQVYSIQPTP